MTNAVTPKESMPDRRSLDIGNCHSEEQTKTATWESLLNCHSEEPKATWESRNHEYNLPNKHGDTKEILTSDVPSSSE